MQRYTEVRTLEAEKEADDLRCELEALKSEHADALAAVAGMHVEALKAAVAAAEEKAAEEVVALQQEADALRSQAAAARSSVEETSVELSHNAGALREDLLALRADFTKEQSAKDLADFQLMEAVQELADRAQMYDRTFNENKVGLYKLNSVAPQLESAWFQPLQL